MRLIDADVMIDILQKSHESHATNSREESLLARDIRLIQEQAKYHPVIFEQRPHGEWIKERLQIDERHFRSFAKCKVCGCEFTPYSFAVKEFDFCPKCGADMRKER